MNQTGKPGFDAEAVRYALSHGSPLSGSLGNNGRIAIERPRPFLFLYRRPLDHDDPGTEELLTTQTSYLVEPTDQTALTQTSELLEAILSMLSTSFANVLLLEVWISPPGSPHSAGEQTAAKITLHAESTETPIQTLEEFDRALVEANWLAATAPEVSIVYDAITGPPEMPDPVSHGFNDTYGVIRIGLEISPYFRDPETSFPHPQVLQELRNNLSHALKRAVYRFIETETSYSQAHYHELGPNHLDTIDLEVDARLAAIDNQLDLLINITPVNASQGWKQFQQNKFECSPEFHYRALQHDPGRLKRDLYTIPIESVEDPALHQMFSDKRQELEQQISMLEDRCTRNFILESQKAYGYPDKTSIATARTILGASPESGDLDSATEFIDAMAFSRHAEEEIAYYRQQDSDLTATVTMSADFPGLMVSHGNLLIGSDALIAKHRINPTLQHEIGTHVLTYHNGGCQPLKLLQTGLAGYEELQEGIAVLSEFLVAGLTAPRFRQIAARVVAVSEMIEGAGFVDVFNNLCREYGIGQRTAYTTTMRVFRGGGFTKDAIYLRGFNSALSYVCNGGELETLLIGKISLRDIEITNELLLRRILNPPRILPRYYNTEQSQQRLHMVKGSKNPIDSIMENLL